MDFFEYLLTIASDKKVYGTIFTIILGYIFYKVAIKILHNLLIKGKDSFEKKRRMTIFNLMRSIITYIFYIIILLIILSLFGVNVTSILASLGIIGAVLGLSLQDTIKDFINGVFIITDNFFVVGDIIKYGDFQGEVISLGFRTTKIKNATGEVKIIANRNISEIINLSQQKAFISIKIEASYEAKKKNIETMIKRLEDKIIDFKDVYNTEYLGIQNFNDSSIEYLLKVECKSSKRWQIQRDIHGLIKDECDAKKFDIPYQKIQIIKEK